MAHPCAIQAISRIACLTLVSISTALYAIRYQAAQTGKWVQPIASLTVLAYAKIVITVVTIRNTT